MKNSKKMLELRAEIISTIKGYHKNLDQDWINSQSNKKLIAWTPKADEGDEFNYKERYDALVKEIECAS